MAQSALRRSDTLATRNGIKALESARDGVNRCLADVEHTRMGLATGYQGSDGRAYGELIGRWEEQCRIILNSLERMIHALETNSAAVTKNQQASNDAIRDAAAKSNGPHGSGSTYHTLMGA